VKVRKAVITAAGRGLRLYPVADTVQKAMLPLVDRDGLAKPVIQIICEEALESGISEICIVCAPGDEARYRVQLMQLRENLLAGYEGVDWARDQAGRVEELLKRLSFAVQEEALGYGHAVLCAREFAGEDPFLLMLEDHLFLSHNPGERCAQQLIRLAEGESCAVAAVNPTREHHVRNYGALSGKRVPDMPGVYEIEKIIEKPSLSTAELELQTPGLRIGHYLCLFGMHVLTHRVFDILKKQISGGEPARGGYQLTPALQELANTEKYLAAELYGSRQDISARYGLLQAQMALGLAGEDRDVILAGILEVISGLNLQRQAGQGG
jgi:UTP--glucose-1-phosphate uridylyltransferase